MNPSGNTMLITGGTSGIGRRLAEEFHRAGNSVIIAGRRRALLDEVIAGCPGMAGYVLDVEDAAAVDQFAGEVVDRHPALNILVNNAGIMREEALTGRRDLADAEATIVTNLLGPIRLTNALIDHLIAAPNAAIVNVTSGLAFVPLPRTPTYCATKAALHSYTLSLRDRLHGQVEVIELVPPGVQTDLTPGQAENPTFMPLDRFIAEVMALFHQQPTPAEICVDQVRFLRDAEAQGRFAQALAVLAAV